MYHKRYVKTEGSEEQSCAFLKRSTTEPIETGRVLPGTLVYLKPRPKQCVEKLEIPGLLSTTRILFFQHTRRHPRQTGGSLCFMRNFTPCTTEGKWSVNFIPHRQREKGNLCVTTSLALSELEIHF